MNQATSSGLSGAASGAATGLTLGANPALMAASGGLSAPIGAAAGLLLGGASGVMQGSKADSEKSKLNAVDPNEILALYNARQREKAVANGTDAVSKNNIDQIKKIQAGANTSAVRSSGGAAGQTINSLLRIQKGSQAGLNQAAAGADNRSRFYTNLGSQLAGKVADRRLQLDLASYSQANSDAAQSRQDSNNNISGALGTGVVDQTIEGIVDLIGKKKEGQMNASGVNLPSQQGVGGAAPQIGVEPEGAGYDPSLIFG